MGILINISELQNYFQRSENLTIKGKPDFYGYLEKKIKNVGGIKKNVFLPRSKYVENCMQILSNIAKWWWWHFKNEAAVSCHCVI